MRPTTHTRASSLTLIRREQSSRLGRARGQEEQTAAATNPTTPKAPNPKPTKAPVNATCPITLRFPNTQVFTQGEGGCVVFPPLPCMCSSREPKSGFIYIYANTYLAFHSRSVAQVHHVEGHQPLHPAHHEPQSQLHISQRLRRRHGESLALLSPVCLPVTTDSPLPHHSLLFPFSLEQPNAYRNTGGFFAYPPGTNVGGNRRAQKARSSRNAPEPQISPNRRTVTYDFGTIPRA